MTGLSSSFPVFDRFYTGDKARSNSTGLACLGPPAFFNRNGILLWAYVVASTAAVFIAGVVFTLTSISKWADFLSRSIPKARNHSDTRVVSLFYMSVLSGPISLI
ncbi:cell wall metabolism sensor histidine kinase WalK [Paenibacillus sp. B2(2019)]|uniref:cell wall metabolism sensor histidine kinase WalK n=1 Tax=Paenibacillus sp. B2(2019) TaxID=2607754 RepID=UPI0011F3E319|nr:cell wall metabolism sensor histidine kinase WalK [Paenibacillus sp. B2(2019)]KAA1187226.1 cell wall metabolism sensor histidine kinase WalK [Paenibacillus sp. B2(2019)]